MKYKTYDRKLEHLSLISKTHIVVYYYLISQDASLYEASQNIPYIEWVINETLRMYPPGARWGWWRLRDTTSNLSEDNKPVIFVLLLHTCRTVRYCKKTIVIHGVTIPEGTVIQVAIDVIHHDPEHYNDPESYIPERWEILFCVILSNVSHYIPLHMNVHHFSFSPEERAGCDPLTHIPFGWGPRQCIGKRFALMEMKMALIHCFRRYKFVRVPETQVSSTLLTIQNKLWIVQVIMAVVTCSLSSFRCPSKYGLVSQLGLLMK